MKCHPGSELSVYVFQSGKKYARVQNIYSGHYVFWQPLSKIQSTHLDRIKSEAENKNWETKCKEMKCFVAKGIKR